MSRKNRDSEEPLKIGMTVLGAGALGSVFISEIVKPFYASQLERTGRRNELHLTLIDYDTIEERNLVSQNFTVQDVGKPKAVALAEKYSCLGVEITPCTEKLEDTNWPEMIHKPGDYDANLVVDLGDNPRVRMLMGEIGQFFIPCLHASLSKGQRGFVRWSTPVKTTFHLNRPLMSVEEIVSALDSKAETLPPCILAEERFSIIAAGQLAAFCALHALGLDRTKLFRNQKFENEDGTTYTLGNCVSLAINHLEIDLEEDFVYPLYKAPDTMASIIEVVDQQLETARTQRVFEDK